MQISSRYIFLFTLLIFSSIISVTEQMCHSSCSITGCAVDNDPTQCNTCYSAYLSYPTVNTATRSCAPDSSLLVSKNIQLLETISENSILPTTYFKNCTVNGNLITSGFSTLFTSGKLQMNSYTTPTITFRLDTLGTDHYGIYFRTHIDQTCTVNRTVQFTVDNMILPAKSMSSGDYFLQTPILLHTSNTLTIDMIFQKGNYCTSRYFQSISIYILKCNAQCATCETNSSNCLTCATNYYKLGSINSNVCVGSCPDGYYLSGSNICVKYELCHSHCGSCTIKNDQSKCTACSSAVLPYISTTLTTPDFCQINQATQNWELVSIINKDSIIGMNMLRQVNYNGINQGTNGTKLNTFLFKQNVIYYHLLTSNVLIFELNNLGKDHYKIFARINVYTECDGSATGNQTMIVTLNSVISTLSIAQNTETIVQTSQSTHLNTTATLRIQLGTLGQTCKKLIQDTSIYLLKCQDYCQSCPDGGSILQYGSTMCLASCPIGYYVGPDQKKCLKCDWPCQDCVTTATNCIKCGVTNNIKYFLYDTDTNDVNAGGTCTPTCIQGLYGNQVTWTCTTCDTGCHTCSISSSNCTQCLKVGISDRYYLQPNTNSCINNQCPTSPIKYFKSQFYTCVTCPNKKYGDWLEGSYNQCMSNCATECLKCYDAGNTNCIECDTGFMLQPNSNTCQNTCPIGYQNVLKKCEKTMFCHSSCHTCQIYADRSKCRTCSFPGLSGMTFQPKTIDGYCDPNVHDPNFPNLEFITQINKNSVIGQRKLQSVRFNGQSYSAPGTALQTILFNSGDLINFDTLTSASEVTFFLTNLGLNHHKVYVRLNALSQCSGANDNTLTLIINGVSKIISSISSSATVYQSDLLTHTTNGLSIKIVFGIRNQNCIKLLQDISVYVKECQPHCFSCPDGGALLQYGSSTCLLTCPQGYYNNADNTQCLKCSSGCIGCFSSATNCNKCGLINNIQYFLKDTDINDVAIGGSCVTDCTGSFYQQKTNYQCVACASGCTLCQNSSTNCTACGVDTSNKRYFLQPNSNSCLEEYCPSRFFKKQDYTCKQCTTGYGNWEVITPAASCSSNCDGNCSKCFASGHTNCLICADGFTLLSNTNTCSATCQPGYKNVSKTCQLLKFCHSSCGTCSVQANKDKCLTCTSSSLTFETGSGQRACHPNFLDATNPNVQFLASIDKSTIIRQNIVKAVSFGGQTYSNTGVALSSILFNSGQLLNFNTLTISSQVTFHLTNLGVNHHKVFVRLNALSTCTTPNNDLTLTIAGTSKTFTGVSSIMTILQSDFIIHTSNSLQLKISFGNINQNCINLIQDISIYIKKCQSHCLSCPDGGSYLQFGSSVCLNTCPQGYYLSIDQTQCFKCSVNCVGCAGTSTNCTKCGIINAKKYFLDDTTADVTTGGVCVENCLSSSYEGLNTFVCQPCAYGCVTCEISSANCTQCQMHTDGTHYYLKPNNVLQCSISCPSGYFKSSTHQCVKCTNGKYGDWDQLIVSSVTAACSITCSTGCAQCFGPLTTQCTECNANHYLQQGTTSCVLNSCPAGYIKDSVNYKCQPEQFCHSSCKASFCVNKADITSCSACESVLYTNMNYLSPGSEGECVPDISDVDYPNLQYLYSMDINSKLGNSYLKSLTKNNIKYSGINTQISSLIYNRIKIIDFDLFTSSSLKLNFGGIGFDHSTVYLRLNAFSSCDGTIKSKTLQIIADGVSILTTNLGLGIVVVQKLLPHTLSTLNLEIRFGTANDNCAKLIQDITLYTQKCKDYCSSCPDGGSILQYGETFCLSNCPDGFYANTQNIQCLKCSSNCTACVTTNTQCTKCGYMLQKNYFLNTIDDTCVDNCPDGYYEDLLTFECKQCEQGCQTCENNSTNCLSCLLQGTTDYYYKQPTINACQLNSCPNEYAKTIDFTCIKCTNGKYGDGVGGVLNQCSIDCVQGCGNCFDGDLQSCFSCDTHTNTTEYFLQPTSTECSTTCPNGYYGQTTSNTCQKCASICQTCLDDPNYCLSCDFYNGIELFLNISNNVCVSSCPIGSYADLDNNECVECDQGCGQCYGPSLDKCTKCQIHTNTSKYFKDPLHDQCKLECDDGQYEQDTTLVCLYCHFGCQTCQTSSIDCTSCKNDSGIIYYWYSPNDQNQCLVSCPQRYYGDSSINECVICDQRCLVCFGSGNDSCTKCQADSNSVDHFLIYNSTECTDICPDGQYSNTTSKQCHLCNPNCLKCQIISTNCTECGFTQYGVKLYIQNNKCVQYCPEGQYRQDTGSTCADCTDGCQTCFGSGLDSCYSCESVVIDVSTTHLYYKEIGATKCARTCPTGQFIDANILHLCQKCSDECVECVNSAKQCSDASSCAVNYFYYSDNSSCLLTCPDGYYPDLGTTTCTQCHEGCRLCTGPLLTDCSKCKTDETTLPVTEYFKRISYNQCTNTCDNGQYEDLSDHLCKVCHFTCSQCLDAAQNCTSCKNVSGIVYFLYNPNDQNECMQVCPSNYYGKQLGNICVQCDQRCLQCFNIGNDSCTVCQPDSNNIPHYLVYNTNICSDVCPDGQYINSTSIKCLLCNDQCKTCENNPFYCTSCHITKYGSRVFLQNNSCVQDCLDGFYQETYNNTCTECEPGCKTCVESGLNNCLSCGNVSTTKYYKHIGANVCGTTCPSGQFIDINIPHLCQPCSPQCLQCIDNSHKCVDSSSCAVGYTYFISNSSCLEQCPKGYFIDSTLKQCVQCHIGCAQCYGASISQCTQCRITISTSIAYFKYSTSTICNITCPNGYYKNTITLQCNPCHNSCSLCSIGPLVCQHCNPGYFYYNSKCLSKCPNNYYGDNVNHVCTICHQGCKICSNNNNLSCTQCQTTLNNVIYYLEYTRPYCSLSCPNGQYQVPLQNKCNKCHINCLTCDISSTNCTSCANTINGYKLYLDQNICVQKCPFRQYNNDDNKVCTDCHQGCNTCFGPNLNQCYTCGKSYDGLNNYLKYINQTICGMNTCPLGQYININYPNHCQPCSGECNACVDGPKNCIQTQNCSDGYYFFNQKNSCLLICPNEYYPELFTGQNYGICRRCQPGCLLCDGPGLTNCQKCTAVNGVNYFKQINIDECVLQCFTGQYTDLLTFTCKLCNPECISCQSTAINCQSCRNITGKVYYHYDNQCLSTCPNGYYIKPSLNKCQPCVNQCVTCFGPLITQCNSCKSYNGVAYYYVQSTTSCQTFCPVGYYSLTSSNVCKKCSQNCAECSGIYSNCTKCSYNTLTLQKVYLKFNKCVLSCSNGYFQDSSIAGNHKCLGCHSYCFTCTGPLSTQCITCKNGTVVVVNNVATIAIYYKDSLSSTCAATCPQGQFIQAITPNYCQLCDSRCLNCIDYKQKCLKCALTHYLYQQFSLCVSDCPFGYFKNPTITASNYICSKCSIGCKTCNGPTLDQCQVCINVTTATGMDIYFKHQTLSRCSLTCDQNYFPNVQYNLCEGCRQECLTCQFNNSYCTSCKTENNIVYYLVASQNICVQTCPQGTFMNQAKLICDTCIYFSYQGQCVLTCPPSTYIDTSTGKSICQYCSAELNNCKPTYNYQLSTKIINKGNSLEHKVSFPAGLSNNISIGNLKDGLKVFLVIADARRRLLASTIQLNVEDLKMGPDGSILYIQTNNLATQIDFTKAKIQTVFKGGVLISQNGVGYSSTLASFQLDDPDFMNSYFWIYLIDYKYMTLGIILCCMSFFLLIFTIVIYSRKSYHEVMAFIMIIQCIGLIRMKQYPMIYQIYTSLRGFCQFEFPFIPNYILQAFPIGYEQKSAKPVQFSNYNHNLFMNIGSEIQVFSVFQIGILIYLAVTYKSKSFNNGLKYKYYQQTLICFFLVKMVYSSLLAIYSLSLNNILQMKAPFIVSQFFSFIMFIGSLVYLFIWVRPYVSMEFYKIQNAFRAISLIVMVSNKYGGIIMLDCLQLLTFSFDYYFCNKYKINKYLYMIQRAMLILAFNSAVFFDDYQLLLAFVGLSLYSIFAIKLYYVISEYLVYRQEKKKVNISLSDIVHASVEEKQQRLINSGQNSPDDTERQDYQTNYNNNSLIKLNDENLNQQNYQKNPKNSNDQNISEEINFKQSRKNKSNKYVNMSESNNQTDLGYENFYQLRENMDEKYFNKDNGLEINNKMNKQEKLQQQQEQQFNQYPVSTPFKNIVNNNTNSNKKVFTGPMQANQIFSDFQQEKSVQQVKKDQKLKRKPIKYGNLDTSIGFYPKRKSNKLGIQKLNQNFPDDVQIIQIDQIQRSNNDDQNNSQISYANQKKRFRTDNSKDNQIIWNYGQNQSNLNDDFESHLDLDHGKM